MKPICYVWDGEGRGLCSRGFRGFKSQFCHLQVVRQSKILTKCRCSGSLVLLICASGITAPFHRIIVKVTERMHVIASYS